MANYYVSRDGKVSKDKKTKQTPSYRVSLDGKVTKVKQTTKKKKKKEDDIAPVKKNTGGNKNSWFKSGGFSDGVDGVGDFFGDLAQTTAGTLGDIGVGVGKGLTRLGEGIVDLGSYGVAGVADAIGKDKWADKTRKKAQKDWTSNAWKKPETFVDKYSVLGNKADAITEGLGQVGGIILTGGIAGALGAGGAAVTAITTGVTGLSSMGSGMSEAYQNKATDKEAFAYGAIAGTAEAATELLFGGLGKSVKALGISKGLSSADDMLAKKISSKFTNQIAKNFTEFGIKAGAEGTEEVLSGIAQAVGKKVTYMSDKELSKLIEDENLLDQFIVGSITSGIAQSGYVPGMKQGSLREANKLKTDFITGLTQNEQKVVDKEYENRITEAEEGGKTLSKKEKNKIYDEVINDLEKGYISTDTIEDALGGETYKTYKSMEERENEVRKEIEELENTPFSQITVKQQEKLTELRKQLDTMEKSGLKNKVKAQLSNEVSELAMASKLSESYNERTRRGQAFQADLTKYDAKQQDVIKKATESGILNNTNRTHEFVDMVAKISADKGVTFDFTNNKKLKESGLAVEGKTVNGYVKDGNIAVNIDSNKSLNSVVGHEITHTLEGTEFYTELQQAVKEYAKTKGEYFTRRDEIVSLYKDSNVENVNIGHELTADLVGDYLFTDSDFINNLSTKKPNIFQKIYNEIKYLCKIATAGSKEARQLEKVKRAFDKAYKESVNDNTEVDTDTNVDADVKADKKYSLTDSNGKTLTKEQQEFFKDSKVRDENGNLLEVYHGTKTEGINIFEYSPDRQTGDDFGEAYYFTSDYTKANGYSYDVDKDTRVKQYTEERERLKKEFLRTRSNDVKEAYKNVKVDGKDLYELMNDEAYNTGGEVKKVYLNLKNPLIVDAEGEHYSNVYEGYFKEAKDGGYDGIIVKNVIDNPRGEDRPIDVYIAFKNNQIKNVDNTTPTTDADIRFSLSKPVEETKDLIAVHNMSTDELAKSLKLGGLPMPSVAIIKAKQNFDKYGDVSLILNKDSIDPQKSKDNKVYGGDAWTPVYPKIEYKANEKVEQQISDKYYELSKKIGYDNTRAMYRYANDLEDTLNRDGGETAMLQKLYDDTEMMQLYLEDSGKGKVEPIVKETRTEVSEAEKARYQLFIDKLGEDAIREITTPEGKNPKIHRAEYFEKYGEQIKKIYADYIYTSGLLNLSKEKAKEIADNTPRLGLLSNILDTRKYLNNGGVTVKEETDTTATNKAIKEKAKDGYKEWIDSLFKGLEEKAGIRNDKDTFTPSGNRRKWDALHWENTLENVIKVMKSQDQTGADAISPSSAIFAVSQKKYNSIDDIKADSDRLGEISEEEYKALEEEYASRMTEIANSITDDNSWNPFIGLDESANLIVDAVRTQKTKAKMLSYMQKWNNKVTEKTVDDIISLVNDISNMPTGYFEAKPQRAVGLDEVGVFVIPYNADAKLKQELLNNGYSIAEYNPEVEGDRQKVVNQFEDYKFSLSNREQITAPYGNYNVYGKDVALEQDIAPTTTQEDTVEPVQEPTQDIAPLTEEQANERNAELEQAPVAEPIIKDKAKKKVEEVNGTPASKLENAETEIANLEQLKQDSYDSYTDKINRLQNEYEAKKNKDTKVANNLLRRIERLARSRADVDADYTKRLENANKRKDLIKRGHPTRRSELHKEIMNNIKAEFSKKGYDFDKVLDDAKNLSTFATVDNTPQRVMDKTLGYKQGNILSDITVNKIAQNESKGTKWLDNYTNRKTGILAQLSNEYKIKPGSKESAAAQMYAEGFYVDENDKVIKYGDKELAKDFPNEKVRNRIIGLASDPRIRKIYDDTLDAINTSRLRNVYPEIPKRKDYFLHFRAMDDTFSKLGLPFNPNDIRAKDLPTDLNGVTADLQPGQPYFASAMRRRGKKTSHDLLGGLERYLSSAKNQIYHIDDIQNLRAIRNYIADKYGQAHGLEDLSEMTEEEFQERVSQVYNSHLSTFAKFLNEEANVIAGKTTLIDRGLEGVIGRRGITFLNTVNKQVGSNMVGFNVSSSGTNFLPVVQTFAKTNKADFFKAFTQTVSNKISSIFGKSDGFAENNPTMIRRNGADAFHRTPYQKVADTGYALMGVVDNISTELIVRTKYNEYIRKGMSHEEATNEADKWASRLMGDRSLGQQPQIFNSKMLGLVTKFQLEVRNQLDSQFYDTIQEAKVSNEEIQNKLLRNAKTSAKIASTFTQLAVAQHLFGSAFEKVVGYNPAFDVVEALIKVFGFDDEEDSEDTVLDNIEQGFLNLFEDLPYASVITGGGRIPISSALPIKELVTGEDEYGEKSRLETLKEIAPYYLLPTGYGQIKKTYEGLSMFDDDLPISGSYTKSGNLRFPIADTTENKVKAGLFGQWANENARTYFDKEIAPLKEKQIKEFIDVDMPINDYWEYREGLKEQKTIEDKFDYIDSLDLPTKKKNILINNIVDRKEDVNMENYSDFSGYEEFDFYSKYPEKHNFLMENNISYKDYNASEDSRDAYNWAFNNPEKYTLSKAISKDVVAYRGITKGLYNIRADKDSNGKTIIGSAKAKKLDYINKLDIDYGEKLVLFKSQYNSDDTYNYEIIDYLNSREDITYEEQETILKQLGFTVTSDGNVYWN